MTRDELTDALWEGSAGSDRLSPLLSCPARTPAWIEAQRRRLEEILVRSLELVGRACVAIGGGELATAER